MLIWYLITLSASRIVLDGYLGIKNYISYLNETTEFLINANTDHFYLIFNELPPESILKIYIGSVNNDYHLNKTLNVDDLGLYVFAEFPFTKYVLLTKNTGKIHLSYGSLQDMCNSGVLITNLNQVNFDFSATNESEYFGLRVGDDKCIIFTDSSQQALMLALEGVNGKLFVYEATYPSKVIYQRGSNLVNVNGKDYPIIVRYVSHSAVNSNTIRVAMVGSVEDPLQPRIAYNFYPAHIPDCPIDTCTFSKAIHMYEIGIALILILSIIILSYIIYYVLVLTACDRFRKYIRPTESTDSPRVEWPSNKMRGENRSEPNGYFTMDPILRPRTDD